jgi:hypothetical protein
MNTPKIKGLGITPHWSSTRWKATGDVDGVGWLRSAGDEPDRGDGGLAGVASAAQRGASTGAPSMFTTRHPVDFPDKPRQNFQIPPDLVVKFQVVDIAYIISW